MVSLLRTADSLYESRVKDEEERRLRKEWERKRADKLKLIHEEEEGLEHLYAEVDNWHQSRRMRAYIDAVRDAMIEKYGQIQEGSACAQWLEWATQQSNRINPLVESPPSILDEKVKWE